MCVTWASYAFISIIIYNENRFVFAQWIYFIIVKIAYGDYFIKNRLNELTTRTKLDSFNWSY